MPHSCRLRNMVTMHCKPFPCCTNPIYLYLNSNLTQPQSICHMPHSCQLRNMVMHCNPVVPLCTKSNPKHIQFSITRAITKLPISKKGVTSPRVHCIISSFQTQTVSTFTTIAMQRNTFAGDSCFGHILLHPPRPPPLSPGFLFIILVATFKWQLL